MTALLAEMEGVVLAEGNQEKLKEHEVVVAQFRALTETRFKLIGLLPLGTVGTLLYVGANQEIVLPVALFGALITFALYIYHLRNDQLYRELVSRAGELERELGLFEGSFVQRPSPWVTLGAGLQIEHGWPVQLVYAATVGLWLSFGLHSIPGPAAPMQGDPPSVSAFVEGEADISGALELKLGQAGKDDPPSLLSPALSMGLSAVVVLALFSWVSASEKRSDRRIKRAVKVAMTVLETLPVGRPPAPGVLSSLALDLRRNLSKPRGDEDKFVRRFEFYLSQEHYARYLGHTEWGGTLGSRGAARLLAQVIDQPARWIFDVHTGRR